MLVPVFILLMAIGAALSAFDNEDSTWKNAADIGIAFSIFMVCIMVTAHG